MKRHPQVQLGPPLPTVTHDELMRGLKTKTKRPKRILRPSLDDPKVVEALCDRLSGGQSIEESCRLKSMPSERAVYARMASDEFFSRRIAHAREAQQEYEADHCVTMADAATVEDWQVVRLRIWARQWRASKLAPRKYGTDRPPPDQSVHTNVLNVTLDPERYEEVARRVLARVTHVDDA